MEDRTGNNLYADRLLALDAQTGKQLWGFQTVHHDLWDDDPAAVPQLATVQHDGSPVTLSLRLRRTVSFSFRPRNRSAVVAIEEGPVPNLMFLRMDTLAVYDLN
jgi:quinoprotein glucose dehydrogenase